jgi:hypothetical protein
LLPGGEVRRLLHFEFYQASSGAHKVPYSFRIAYLLVCLAVIVNAWRRWTEHVLKSNDERLQKRPRVKWLLRPSNLLMLVSASSFMFWGLHKECAASGYLFVLSWIGIGAAFVVSRWEDQFLNQWLDEVENALSQHPNGYHSISPARQVDFRFHEKRISYKPLRGVALGRRVTPAPWGLQDNMACERTKHRKPEQRKKTGSRTAQP